LSTIADTFANGHWHICQRPLAHLPTATGTFANGHWHICQQSLALLSTVTDTFANSHWHFCQLSLALSHMIFSFFNDKRLFGAKYSGASSLEVLRPFNILDLILQSDAPPLYILDQGL
jgi:hypothetical protein